MNSKRSVIGFLLVISLLCFATVTTAFAADVTAKIRGTVTDASGAAIPNASVVATNTQTGINYTTKSSSDGSFQISSLPVGSYNLNISADKFQTFHSTGITLVIDQVYVQTAQLKIGDKGTVVEVAANAAQVETTNIQLSNVINADQIVDLPLIGRNFTQLELLTPGVQASSDRFGTFSVNGAQTQQSSFLINGADTNDLPLNTPIYVPSVDAISQFTVVSNSMDAQYSRNSGAVVSAAIKNGTNAFHGDAFDFYRDSFLQSHSWFQKTASPFHQHIFGGTIGGPIWKDKAFFFFSYQGLRGVVPQGTSPQTVYTAAELAGNFSQLVPTLVSETEYTTTPGGACPQTVPPNTPAIPDCSNKIPSTVAVPGCAGMTWAQCLIPTGGILPGGAATMNAVAKALVAKYVPAPNSGTNGFVFNSSTLSVQDQYLTRFDYNLTSKDQLWGLMLFQRAPSSDGLPFTGASLPGFGDVNTRSTHQFSVNWTHTFNSNTLNTLLVTYTRFNFGAVNPQVPTLPATAGFSITPQNPAGAGLPVIGVGGSASFSLGFSTNGPQPRLDQNRTITDNLQKNVGRHSFKFGVTGSRFNVDNPFFNSNSGSYSFGANGAGTGGPFSTGDGALDFLLGIPDSYTQGTGAQINAYAYEGYAYAQDTWKARNNLTLTLGVGYQVDSALHNRQYGGIGVTCYIPGQQSKIFPTATLGLNYPGDPGCNDATGNKTAWGDVGPRVGFAWSPHFGRLSGGSSPRMAIRGGFAILYNRTEEETSLQNLGDPPFGFSSSGFLSGTGGPSFANPFHDINSGASIPNPFPGNPAPTAATAVFSPPYEGGLSQYAANYKPPYSLNYNFSIERELPSNIIFAVRYVGAIGRNEQSVFEGNPTTTAGQAACLADPVCIANRNNQALFYPGHTQFGSLSTTVDPSSPTGLDNNFTSAAMIGSQGFSNYNSLQVSATKNTTHGLLFQASYTWAHALDNASSFENAGFGGARGFNQYQPSLNYGNAAFDVRQRFVFSPVYTIPNWKNLHALSWMPDVVGKGWQISGISTFATGFPFDIAYDGSTGRSLFCSPNFQFYACPDVPNQTGTLVMTNPRTLQTLKNNGSSINGYYWFSNNALTGQNLIVAETIGTFGNISRNKYHGPGILNTDMVLAKNIYFWRGNESRYLQLRYEGYNVFNHTQFSNPNGSFGSSNFGRITSTAAARQQQLALKIYF